MIGIELCAFIFAYVFYKWLFWRLALGLAAHAENITAVNTREQASDTECDLRICAAL